MVWDIEMHREQLVRESPTMREGDAISFHARIRPFSVVHTYRLLGWPQIPVAHPRQEPIDRYSGQWSFGWQAKESRASRQIIYIGVILPSSAKMFPACRGPDCGPAPRLLPKSLTKVVQISRLRRLLWKAAAPANGCPVYAKDEERKQKSGRCAYIRAMALENADYRRFSVNNLPHDAPATPLCRTTCTGALQPICKRLPSVSEHDCFRSSVAPSGPAYGMTQTTRTWNIANARRARVVRHIDSDILPRHRVHICYALHPVAVILPSIVRHLPTVPPTCLAGIAARDSSSTRSSVLVVSRQPIRIELWLFCEGVQGGYGRRTATGSRGRPGWADAAEVPWSRAGALVHLRRPSLSSVLCRSIPNAGGNFTAIPPPRLLALVSHDLHVHVHTPLLGCTSVAIRPATAQRRPLPPPVFAHMHSPAQQTPQPLRNRRHRSPLATRARHQPPPHVLDVHLVARVQLQARVTGMCGGAGSSWGCASVRVGRKNDADGRPACSRREGDAGGVATAGGVHEPRARERRARDTTEMRWRVAEAEKDELSQRVGWMKAVLAAETRQRMVRCRADWTAQAAYKRGACGG
ncbi:hypothetical protein C8J57DRAFT_1233219 [Mycena rebaudengoi]|nr:hypothetical protein C8J57DRAFT_1233219 [Mycena rebaudengoi]